MTRGTMPDYDDSPWSPAGSAQYVAPGMPWGVPEEVARLVDGVEGLVAAHLPAHLHPVVEAVLDLLRRRRHRHVGVGDVEDLVAQPVGLEAALDHLTQVAGVDVGEQVATPQRRVGEERREHVGVLVRFDDVVDPQAVDVRPGAGLEGARRHLAGDLRHRVGVLGDRRVLLVDGHVERAPLALGETDPVGRLRGGEHDLAHSQPGRGLEHVVGAQDVRRVRRRVRGEQDRRYRGEVHDGVVGGRLGQVQLVEASPTRPAPSRSPRHR